MKVNIISFLEQKKSFVVHCRTDEEILKLLKLLEDNTKLKWIDGMPPTNLWGLRLERLSHINIVFEEVLAYICIGLAKQSGYSFHMEDIYFQHFIDTKGI